MSSEDDYLSGQTFGLLVVLTGQINFTSKRKKKTIHFQAFQEDKHLFPFMFLLVRLAC